MIFAELSAYDPPIMIGTVLGCLVFLIVGANAAMDFYKNVKTTPGQPPNEQIDLSVGHLSKEHKETRSRVIALETWRHSLNERLERDKQEILNAGEEREKNLQRQINELRQDVHGDLQNIERKNEERAVKIHDRINDLGTAMTSAIGELKGELKRL